MTSAYPSFQPELPLGLYIHVPFCRVRCSYCDFATDLEKDGEREAYLQHLCTELDSLSLPTESIDTVYFGGGTPSVLTQSDFTRIFGRMRQYLTKGPEITLEANPEAVTLDSLHTWQYFGINRISVGIQSLQEKELRILARGHLRADNRRALSLLQDNDWNFNVDIMLGIPHQTRQSLKNTMLEVLNFSPPHISCYLLSVEEEAPWYSQVLSGRIKVADEELAASLYSDLRSCLIDSGYEHYEISAFAKAGQRCQHNLRYWKYGSWVGVGPSAASHYPGVRWQNPRIIKDWLKWSPSTGFPITPEVLSPSDSVLEQIMLQFRLLEGINRQEYTKLDSHFPELHLNSRLERLCTLGLVVCEAEHWRISSTGLLLANLVFSEFVN